MQRFHPHYTHGETEVMQRDCLSPAPVRFLPLPVQNPPAVQFRHLRGAVTCHSVLEGLYSGVCSLQTGSLATWVSDMGI
jgi:hypothetical protein